MATELYANLATTTVSSGGTDAPSGGTSESWTVASSTPFPAASTGTSQFHVIDPAAATELITVTNVSGTTWTVTRGAESTTPVAHTAGFTIWQVVTAGDLTGLATLASPALTGTPTAPTASPLTDSTQVATTAYADTAVGVEKTRAEAAEALLAPLASPALTGSPTAPTKTALTNNTDIATTAYTDAAVAVETSRAETAEALALPLAGGTMSGAIAMGSHKITGLTNGSASSDAAAFGQIPVADSNAAHIQKVGTAGVAGSNGEWADSGHAHQGLFVGMFGAGTDGALTFDGTSTVAGLSPSGSTYTMTRDLQATTLTINNSVIVKTAGYRIFCQGALTNNGTINGNGNNASGSSAGGSSGAGFFGSGKGGGGGGTGASGTGGAGTGASFGASGGAGGAGVSGGSGAGGTATQSAATTQNNIVTVPFVALTGIVGYGGSNLQYAGGAGGGGGGSDSSSNAGGGGGGGGQVVAIFAWSIGGTGTIEANGGGGAAAAAGSAGGGGGGAGGAVLTYTLSAPSGQTITASGGSLGAGHGSGSNGSAGGTGVLMSTVLA